VKKIQTDKNFISNWLDVEKEFIHRKRKKRKILVSINEEPDLQLASAA